MKIAAGIAVAAAFLALAACHVCAEDNQLSKLVKDRQPIKVFVNNIVNGSGKNDVAVEELKKVLEKSIINRRAVRFELVDSPEKSDVQISGTVKQYQYLEKGPMKPGLAPGGIFIEMAASSSQNYAEMTVEFTVIDTKTSGSLWKEDVNSFVRKVMTPAESMPLIYDRVSRDFLSKSFGNPKH